MFNLKRKPRQTLEGLRTEYSVLKKQHERNVEAGQLKGKIFALKHPMLMNVGKGMEQMGKQQQGRGRRKSAGDVFSDIDKRFEKL